MIRVFTAADIAVNQQPLPEDQLITPGVTAGEAEVDATGPLEVGVWEHSVGSSTAVEIDEVFVIISGRGRITDASGNVVELAPGVVGVLPAGT